MSTRTPAAGRPDGASPTGPGRAEGTSELVERVLDVADVRRNRDLIRRLVDATLRLARDDTSRLDLKIAGSAIAEMADAFKMFAPLHDVPKVTIFGSARAGPSDALYVLARDLARRMAESGWMVVTGAGPGIMAAGNEGAGRDMAIGVNIQLPFESEPNPWIEDEKLVEMKYFFTRKLMLMKESTGFLVLPGGFGTLDEAFELLTLLQTGKAEPAPIALVDTPGGTYWQGWERFVTEQVYANRLADELDASLYRVTDDVEVAADELLRFHRNYHSRRFVGKVMVIRLRHAPSEEDIGRLGEEFSDITSGAGIWRTEPLPAERASHDHLELARIAMEFDRAHHGRLRQLIDALNDLVPPGTATDTPPAGETGTFTGGDEEPPPEA
ncbi:MAG TPA: TIGR00730 family Rossman fold protein [Acidimicrobiales bacterium]|nr:TIGR00730 family Rossman fold protein [Acidimicrobiales bacterium]